MTYKSHLLKCMVKCLFDKIVELSYKTSFNNNRWLEETAGTNLKTCRDLMELYTKWNQIKIYEYINVFICAVVFIYWCWYVFAIFTVMQYIPCSGEIYKSYFFPYRFLNLFWRTVNSRQVRFRSIQNEHSILEMVPCPQMFCVLTTDLANDPLQTLVPPL